MWKNRALPAGMYLYLSLKVDLPNSATYLNWTPTFERYVVRCGSKNRY